MTYLDFHFAFTIPLFFLMSLVSYKAHSFQDKKKWFGCALLCVLAFVYTTPWDSYLIRENIWNYSPGQVVGTLFYIPFEEYFFFFIQSIIGCLFTAFLLKRFKKNKSDYDLPIKVSQLFLIATLFTICAFGFFFLTPNNQWRYLWLIIYWGVPIVGLQWILGAHVLFAERRIFLTAVIVLTSYFWFADSVAIKKEIWTFPEETLSGLKLFNVLPIEEALFFLLTNLMVVQGFLLFTQVTRVPVLKKYEWRF